MVAASSLLPLAIVVVIAARGIGGTFVSGAETDGACHQSGAVCSPHRPLPQEHLLLQMSSNRGSAEVQRHDMSVEDDTPIIGFPNSGDMQASGLWCSVPAPPDQWNLKTCPFSRWAFAKTRVKVLTYNLFWWNLFGRRAGDGRSAGKLIAQTAGSEGYDLVGFQECDDRSRILGDAKAEGLQGDWEALDGGRALGLMYRKDRFQLLESGAEDVGEDSLVQWYGKRSAVWVRLRHVDGTTVFFINHHGPLPVSASGGCTGSATAHNIMRVIATHAHGGDAIILTGDFNAEPSSSRIEELNKRLNKVYSGTSMGGVDHIFSNCAQDAQGQNLGKGAGQFGSDRDALSVTFRFR